MRSNEQLVQETLLAQLSEYQHQQQQQLDELNPFTGAAKAAGAVSGAIKGAGQKVAGTAKRATSAMGNAFKQGQTSAQKAVAGQDYKAPAAKPGSSKIMKGLQAVGRGVGAVGDLKSKVQGYDVATGTKKQQAAAAAGTTVAGMAADKRAAAKAADTTQSAQPAASDAAQPAASATPKVTATGGGVAPIATTGAAPKATTVPGQKPAATGTEKPAAEPAKTAQDIAAKTGAATPTKKPDLKIAGQKVKPTDPLYDKLVAMIPAETRSSIDGLSDYDKGRLKKELSA